jgi:prepilin-type N-terminal cleavage/methylation domain-containing protein
MNKKGFTLIEVIIYLALLTIIFTATGVVVYTIFEGSDRDSARIQIQTEGDFILAKINWAMNNASNITVLNLPLKLSITKNLYNSNPIIFFATNTKLQMKEGMGLGQDLNNDQVLASNLTLQDLPANSQRPHGFIISFTLSAISHRGGAVTQDFESTFYLNNSSFY